MDTNNIVSMEASYGMGNILNSLICNKYMVKAIVALVQIHKNMNC
jgi:hypothetical protein